jgi:hypothetical protein
VWHEKFVKNDLYVPKPPIFSECLVIEYKNYIYLHMYLKSVYHLSGIHNICRHLHICRYLPARAAKTSCKWHLKSIHNKNSFLSNSYVRATYEGLKPYIHPGGIRTNDLMFWMQTRWPLRNHRWDTSILFKNNLSMCFPFHTYVCSTHNHQCKLGAKQQHWVVNPGGDSSRQSSVLEPLSRFDLGSFFPWNPCTYVCMYVCSAAAQLNWDVSADSILRSMKWFSSRATRFVCEKIAQNVAPNHFVSNLTIEKSSEALLL